MGPMRAAALAAALSLAGCSTVMPVSEPAQLVDRVGTTPNIGETATAAVGGEVLSQFRYTVKRGLRISRAVVQSVGLGRTHVPEGAFLFRSRADGQPALCTELKTYIDPLAGPHTTSCFLDGGGGSLTTMKVAPGLVWFTYQLSPPVPFSEGEVVIPRSDGFRRELIFQGKTGATLRLAYREYSNDMARPAYYQDATYDIATLPAVIAFRTAKIEVLAVDNTGMRYRVLGGF